MYQYGCRLQVGDRDDSNLYISMKLKAAAEVQHLFTHSSYTTHFLQTVLQSVPTSGLISASVNTDRNKRYTHEIAQDCNGGGGESGFEVLLYPRFLFDCIHSVNMQLVTVLESHYEITKSM